MKRVATLSAPQDIGAAGTQTIPINVTDQISRIMICWQNTTVTVSDMLARIADCITKVEVVDGSDVLFSMTGAQAAGLSYLQTKVPAEEYFGLVVGNINYITIPINFGRYLWDPEYALAPDMFKNLQLKITWDEDASNTAVVVNSLSVYCWVDSSPFGGHAKGMLSSQLYQQYAMGASAHEYIVLPTDRPIRQIAVMGLSADHAPSALLDNVQISIDNDKAVPFDLNVHNYIRMLYSDYPVIVRNYCLDGAVTAQALFTDLAEEVQMHIEYDDTAVTAAGEMSDVTVTGYNINLSLAVEVLKQRASIRGRHPGALIPYPFGELNSPESWLQPGEMGSLRADILTTAAADNGDTGGVIVEQLRYF